MLRAHRRAQLAERLAVGAGYRDGDLVFCQPDGTALDPDGLSQRFARHVRDSRLPPIRLHDLRHTFATQALAAGVPVKVVSERLGRATTAITANTYQHVTPGMDADAAARVAGVIDGM